MQRGFGQPSSDSMSELTIVKKQLQQAQARYAAALISAKAYRGVPYDAYVTNGKPVGRPLAYRGIRHYS